MTFIFFDLKGNSFTFLEAKALHEFFKTQVLQSGFLGTHCMAQNSIMAWLKIPGFFLSINAKAASLNIFLDDEALISF